jgi:PKD repeat protein
MPTFGQPVIFNASASTRGWNGTGFPSIVSYRWSFGDGNITTTSTPIVYHVYASRGNYTVTLTVTDAAGRTSTQTKVLTVSSLIGDLNGDGKVDIKDVSRVAKAYGSTPGSQYWDPVCDLNGDGKVDIKDVSTVAKHFGEHV